LLRKSASGRAGSTGGSGRDVRGCRAPDEGGGCDALIACDLVRPEGAEYVFDPLEYEKFAPWNAQVLFYGAATAPAFALAWLSWRWFEAPILRLKARFPYSRASAS